MINDNRQPASWPGVTVVEVVPVDHTFPDHEPQAQKLTLSCRHWIINTFGNKFKEFQLGDTIRCCACSVLQNKAQLRYTVTFKLGQREVAKVEGHHSIDAGNLTVAEVTEKVQQTEAFLEKLTGYRVHIEQIE